MNLSNTQIAKQNKALLKSLGINVSGLIGYHKMYGTTPYTFGYKDSSVWFCSINKTNSTIEINTKYFDCPEAVLKYNKTQLKKHTKFNANLFWDAYKSSIVKLRNGVKLNIHDKINISTFTDGIFNYSK
jgi:hypothetical protein